MKNKQIANALVRLVPVAKWTLVGDNYDDIEWLCECPKPTKSEISAEIAKEPDFEAAREALRQSRREKLIALGLTEEELDA